MPAASKSQSYTNKWNEYKMKNKNKIQKQKQKLNEIEKKNRNQNTYLIQPINNSRLVNRKITVCLIFKNCCCCIVAFKKN